MTDAEKIAIERAWAEISPVVVRLAPDASSEIMRVYRMLDDARNGLKLAGWLPIGCAPMDGREIILGMFRPEHETPIVMNSCWIDREDRGGQWSDWHGLPAPTHWQPLETPQPA